MSLLILHLAFVASTLPRFSKRQNVKNIAQMKIKFRFHFGKRHWIQNTSDVIGVHLLFLVRIITPLTRLLTFQPLHSQRRTQYKHTHSLSLSQTHLKVDSELLVFVFRSFASEKKGIFHLIFPPESSHWRKRVFLFWREIEICWRRKNIHYC